LISVVSLAVALVALAIWTDRRADRREAEAAARFPARGQMIDVGNGTIHAELRGDGPDLILIHGAGGSTREIMAPLADTLARDFRVIAFDRPGHGHSARLAGSNESPAEQARALMRAAAALGVERPLIVGHSYGGAVALAWALEAPGAAAGLVLLGAVSHEWPGPLDPTYRHLGTGFGRRVLIPLATAFLTRDRMHATLADIFAPQPVPDGYAEAVGARLSTTRKALRASVGQVNRLRPQLAGMSQRYAGLDLPVEIVHGTDDQVVGFAIHAEPLARDLPDARLTPLPGIGHMPHHVATPEVLAAIRRAAGRTGLPGAR